MHLFEALPAPLLALILISSTSRKDKKALRQTCRLFKRTLDNNMTCLSLELAWAKKGKDLPHVEKLLKRVQHVDSMREVALMHDPWGSLLQLLPEHITTLRITGYNINIKALSRLPKLASLFVDELGDRIDGMEHLSGLSRLHCSKAAGPLAHLSSTLTCLRVQTYEDVPDMNQLTELKVLAFEQDVSAEFFKSFGQLPLEELSMNVRFCNDAFIDPKTWEASPTTLTRLNLGLEPYVRVLPSHITHLKLGLMRFDTLNDIVAALPGLKCLDVFCPPPLTGEGVAQLCQDYTTVPFLNLSKLTNLECLGIAVMDHSQDRLLQCQQVLSLLPEVARAADRGVKLIVMEVVEEMMNMFNDPWASFAPAGSAWATAF